MAEEISFQEEQVGEQITEEVGEHGGETLGGLESFLHPLGELLDPIFSPLTVLPPYVAILIMSILLTGIITFVSRLFVNRKLMMKVKEEMEEIKEKLNHAQKNGEKEEQDKYLSELMAANGKYMKHTMKIMVVSIAVVMIFFPWISLTYSGMQVVNLPFELPIVGWTSLEWFWWYVITAFAAGTVLRRIMGSDI